MNETVDVAAMIAVHDGLRKEFASLPLLVKSTPEADSDRVAIVADHIDLMVVFLQAHHRAEDEILWPLIVERVPEKAQSGSGMRDEHAHLEQQLDGLLPLTTAWRAAPTANDRAALHRALINFERTLLTHLGHEEADAMRIAGDLLTPEEFAELEANVWSRLTVDQQFIVLGLIFGDTKPDRGAALLSTTSAEVRERYEHEGHARYREYRQRLLGA